MKHYVTKNILPAILALFLLAGCGKADAQDSQGGYNSGSSFRVESTVSIEWEELGEDGQEMSVSSGARGDTLYLLVSESAMSPDRWLYTFCMDTGETAQAPFSLETPGMDAAYVLSMTVTGEGELTLRLFGTLEGSDSNTFLCRTDLAGKCLDQVTPIREDGEFPPVSGRVWSGSDGFALVAESGESHVSDILRYDLSDQTPEMVTTVAGFVKALCPDGQEGLYYIEDDYLWHLDLQEGTAERLFSMGETGIALTLDNYLLTDGEGRLAVCCVSTGGAQVYLLTDGEEVSAAGREESSGQPENLGQPESTGQPESSGQPKPVEYETIRMADLYMGSEIVSTAREWSAKSDRYRITAETEFYGTQEWEAIRTRTLADLTAGKGPELLVVSADDLHILAEKGALLDLSELVPEDIQEQLLPGVRELGTVDGVWVGLGWSPARRVIFAPDELWSGDTWTISDIMELVEESEELEWILGYRDLTIDDSRHYNDNPDAASLLWFLVMNSLGDSPFLDLDNNEGYFDGEEFIRVLEFCKRYGQKMSQKDGEEREAMLQEGHMLAMWSPLYSGFYSYSNIAVRLPGCHPVGYPAEKGSGNYISSDNYLVVNADTSNLEAVKDCIAYLYSYESQMSSSTVRKDVADDQIVYDSGEQQWILKIIFGHTESWMWPDKGPNGDSLKEEYLAFLENCEPAPYCPQAIKDIVEEESSQFFDGDRSAKETAEVIQRRVQLYLDEQ